MKTPKNLVDMQQAVRDIRAAATVQFNEQMKIADEIDRLQSNLYSNERNRQIRSSK